MEAYSRQSSLYLNSMLNCKADGGIELVRDYDKPLPTERSTLWPVNWKRLLPFSCSGEEFCWQLQEPLPKDIITIITIITVINTTIAHIITDRTLAGIGLDNGDIIHSIAIPIAAMGPTQDTDTSIDIMMINRDASLMREIHSHIEIITTVRSK